MLDALLCLAISTSLMGNTAGGTAQGKTCSYCFCLRKHMGHSAGVAGCSRAHDKSKIPSSVAWVAM